MKITVGGKLYEYDAESLTNKEAAAIETALDVTFTRWTELLKAGSVHALTALVWIVQRRENPALRFGDVEFAFTDLQIDDDTPAPLVEDEPTSDVST